MSGKQMTVAQAAKVWAEEKQEIEARKARMDAAADVLKDWFREHPKQRDYRGLIGFAVSSRLQLDTAKVKTELGDRLPDFQKRVTYEQLSLLK